MSYQYVTLVAFGGTPVRLADQSGAPLPTTGTGALVFANGPVLTNATITGDFDITGDVDIAGNLVVTGFVQGANEPINVRWYDALGNGSTDDAAAINSAIAAAFVLGTSVYFPVGTYAVGSQILSNGVSLYGEGRSSVIAPLSTFPIGDSIVKYKPGTNSDLPDKWIRLLTIWPKGISGGAGPAYGNHCLELDFTNLGVSTARFLVEDCFFLTGNGMAIFSNNPRRTILTTTGNKTSGVATVLVPSTAGVAVGMLVTGTGIQTGSAVLAFVTNTSITMTKTASATSTDALVISDWTSANGNPYLSAFNRNILYGGTKFVGLGDSVNFTENYCFGENVGVEVRQVTGSLGTAANFVMRDCNGNHEGGFFKLVSGFTPIIEDNNIEQSAGAGSNGAVIDIDGSENYNAEALQVALPKVKGNKIGVFGATTATTAIRIANCINAVVDENELVGTGTQAISITSLANNTTVGPRNAYALPGIVSGWTSRVADSGTKTSLPYMTATTPTPTAGNSQPFGAAAATLNWRRNENSELVFDGSVTITTNGAAGTYVAVPLPYASLRRVPVPAADTTNGLLLGQCVASETQIRLYTPLGGYPGADGDILYFSGTIPVAP